MANHYGEIIISDAISAKSGGGQLYLNDGGDDIVFLGNNHGSWHEVLYLSDGYIELSSYANASADIGIYTDNNDLRITESNNQLQWSGNSSAMTINDTQFSVGMGGFAGFTQLATATTVLGRTSFITANNTSAALTTSAIDQYGSIISARKSIIASGVTNSAIIGGKDINAKTDDTAYANQLGLTRTLLDGTPHAFETVLRSVIQTADRLIELPDNDGTLALLSDVTGSVSGTAGQVAYFSGTNAVTSESGFEYNSGTNTLSVVNLNVSGTTTTIDSTVTTIADPIITIGGVAGGGPPTTDDNKDRGIAFQWYSGSAKMGFFGFDDSTGRFTFIPDGTNTSEVFSGAVGAVDFGDAHITGSITLNGNSFFVDNAASANDLTFGAVDTVNHPYTTTLGFGPSGQENQINTNADGFQFGLGSSNIFRFSSTSATNVKMMLNGSLTGFDFATNTGAIRHRLTTLGAEAGKAWFNIGQDSTGDFIVAGGTDANNIFSDASTDRVGIGTATPGAKLHVRNGNISNDVMLVENNAGGDILNITEAGAVTFNTSGLPGGDFTIEGDTDTLLFKTNAADNSVGIGIAGQTTSKLYVDATNEVRSYIGVFGSNTAANGVFISQGAAPAANSFGLRANAQVTGNFTAKAGDFDAIGTLGQTNYGVYARAGNGLQSSIALRGQVSFTSNGVGISAGVHGSDDGPLTLEKIGVYGTVSSGTAANNTYALRGRNTSAESTGAGNNYGLHSEVILAAGVENGTNYAGYFDVTAVGAGNTNYGIVVASAINSGFGTATPTAVLDVNGSVRFRNLTTTPAAGYVLQSTDANGNADWVDTASLVPGTPTELSGTTTDNSITEIFVGGVASNRVDVASESVVGFEITAVAVQDGFSGSPALGTVGDTWMHTVKGAIKNIAGTTSLVGAVTDTTIAEDTGATGWTITVDADDTNDALRVRVTGENNKSVKWVVSVKKTVVSY